MNKQFRRAAFFLMMLIVAAGGAARAAWAEDNIAPLTQADIDGYIYLLPRLASEAGSDPEAAAAALWESGLNRRRAAYAGAKISIAQALLTGLMTADQLVEKKVPDYLKPSAAELRLVDDNRESLSKAQQEARRKAAPDDNASPAVDGLIR